jgi:hypothetical protein
LLPVRYYNSFQRFLQPLFLLFFDQNHPFSLHFYPISARFSVSKTLINQIPWFCYFLTLEICLKKIDEH